jgi:hypothetical protein
MVAAVGAISVEINAAAQTTPMKFIKSQCETFSLSRVTQHAVESGTPSQKKAKH